MDKECSRKKYEAFERDKKALPPLPFEEYQKAIKELVARHKI
jgi:hypothetical protein